MGRATPGAIAVTAGLAVSAWFAAASGMALGDDLATASSAVFSCIAEAGRFIDEHGAGEIRTERDRRLAVRAVPDEPGVVTAHRWCVVAELMRSLGDDAAAQYYARAIAATGDPGYELQLADYFRIVRGPRVALDEQAERHYRAALDGVRARAAQPGASDDAIAERASRGLLLVYQQDGLVLLPWKLPRGRTTSPFPSIAVMVAGRVAFDTNHTPVDPSSPAQVDDARRFTSEAMFAASRFRKARPLAIEELQAIARAPLRTEIMARGRLRSWPVGALDLWYRQSRIDGGEITSYQQPAAMNDVAVSELGAGVSRALDLAPAFDLLVAADYRRVHRVGTVESAPMQAQDIDVFSLRPAIARFLGPDKLSLSATATVLAIPDVAGGVVAERARGRIILSFDVDHAVNRLRFPLLSLSAWHMFAGAAQDEETFGTRVVRRRDAYAGLQLPGLRRWDITVQASMFFGAVDVSPPDPAQAGGTDPEQNHAQYRTTLVLVRRLIDEDARPARSGEPRGIWPSLLNAVVTLRHDLAIDGPAAYENLRAGVDLWAKLFLTGLRDTAVLLSAGYDNQYFYNLGKDLHVVHLDVRMGW